MVTQAVAQASAISKTTKQTFNMDLIITASILHDIGKLYTYAKKGMTFEVTEEGNFLEHIVMGTHIVMTAGQHVGMLTETLLQVTHCIAAHHGKLQWGSPVEPATPEAMIVHYADLVTSRMAIVYEAIEQTDKRWTDKNYLLGVRLFTGKEPYDGEYKL